VRFLADVNFNGNVLRGLARRTSDYDLIRAVDTGLDRTKDPDLLAYAARNNRIVLTLDVKTMAGFAYDRVARGLEMPGVFEVPESLGVARSIEELLTVIGASEMHEWQDLVTFFPLSKGKP
jgi:hypothetical protein